MTTLRAVVLCFFKVARGGRKIEIMQISGKKEGRLRRREGFRPRSSRLRFLDFLSRVPTLELLWLKRKKSDYS